MKDFDDIFKERLEGYEMKLPASDRDAFLNRKATREHYARLRRNILGVAVGIPAAAAIIMAIMMTSSLLTKQDSNADDQQLLASVNKEQVSTAQNNDEMTNNIQDQNDIDESILTSCDDLWVDLDGDGCEMQPGNQPVLSQVPGEEDVYIVVEEGPEYPDGTQALLNYLRNNMIYPDSCRENNIQGRVIVTFIVEKDGSITKPVVVKSVNHLLDAEALRLVSNMPKWKPGKQNGEACRVKYSIPVNFRLN